MLIKDNPTILVVCADDVTMRSVIIYNYIGNECIRTIKTNHYADI